MDGAGPAYRRQAANRRPRSMTISKLQPLEEMFGPVPHLDGKDLRAIYRRVQKLHLRRGDVLIRKGDKAEALFFPLTGRFAVYYDENARPIAEIESGVPIGEIAFFAGGTRTATVVALRDAVVLKLRRPEFEDLEKLIPGLAHWVIRGLAQRLKDTVARLPGVEHIVAPRTIALVPAGAGTVPERFIELMKQVFLGGGRAAFMRSETIRMALPSSRSLDDPTVTAWLNAHEEKSRFVVYVSDDAMTEWTRKAVRQADLVLLIATAGAAPQVNNIERFVNELHSADQQHLVILHEERAGEVAGTEHWLADRQVLLHHHVALTDAVDVARLKRFVEGSALGLVCCGGGSFCSIHVGINKAFTEAGLRFDIYGGTSGGGAMAAAFARGLPAEEIDRRTHDIFVTRRSLQRVTLPYYSVFDHKPFDEALREHYGTRRIENLWLPFFALATNLSDATPHLIRTGPVWEAVRATGSIPGMLPPFLTPDGIPLVDGSVIDNVPLDAMKTLKRGPNVIVDFAESMPAGYDGAYEDLPGRGTLLLRQLLPFGRAKLPRFPSLAATIIGSMMATQKKLANLTDDDLVLAPPLPDDVSVMDWRQHTRLLADGYAFAAAELDRPPVRDHPALRKARAIACENARYLGEAGGDGEPASAPPFEAAEHAAYEGTAERGGD